MAALLKVTFTLDTDTIHRLEDAASQLALPKSQVVREAIADFHDRLGRLSEKERTTMLRAFDEFVPRIAPRSANDVARELAEIRQTRKAGRRKSTGRKHTAA